MNNITCIVLHKNQKDKLYELFNIIPNKLKTIVGDLRSDDGVNFSYLHKNTLVISKSEHPATLLNDILINHVNTEYVLLLDLNTNNLSINNILIMNNKKGLDKVIIDKNNILFPLNVIEHVGLFDKNQKHFKEVFVSKIHKHGYSRVGQFLGLTPEALIEIDRSPDRNLINEPVSIIFPNATNSNILDKINKTKNEHDELITFKSGNITLAKKIHTSITKAKYDNIIIINPITSTLDNLILKFKYHFNKKQYLISHTLKKNSNVKGIINIIKPTAQSSIAFNKNIYNGIEISANMLFEDIINSMVSNTKEACKSVHYIDSNEVIDVNTLKEKKEKKENKKKTIKPDDIKDIKDIIIIGRKPKILLLTDVAGWAWDYKSQQLQKHLNDDFDIDIHHLITNGYNFPKDYDLYMSYGYSYIDCMKSIPKRRKISGITAHRPKRIISKQLNKVHAAHANSILLLEELKEIHPNTFYVPNGVDEEKFNVKHEISLERNNLVAGHVGKLCNVKGQKKYIEPACKLAKIEYKPHYNNYMNSIPHDEMPNFYDDMDVFIVASIEDGTPNGALEAAACGRPIISNKIGNMPEFIINGYNGFLVDLNVESYVEVLTLLKNDRTLLKRMGENARRTIEQNGWRWKDQAERYRKMFWAQVDNYEK